jgi:hypothetical protein
MKASFVLVVSIASSASAQWNVARFDSTKVWTYATFGLDPAFVATVGVSGVIGGRARVQLGAEFGSVVAAFDMRDWRARAIGRTTVAHLGWFRVTGEEAVIARGTSNSIYSAVNVGASTAFTAGAYQRRWFFAAEAGFDKAIATRVTNSEWYREWYYADAKNGWYVSPGGTFHAGLIGGVNIGRLELVARAGQLRTEQLNAMNPPMYGTLGVGLGW